MPPPEVEVWGDPGAAPRCPDRRDVRPQRVEHAPAELARGAAEQPLHRRKFRMHEQTDLDAVLL